MAKSKKQPKRQVKAAAKKPAKPSLWARVLDNKARVILVIFLVLAVGVSTINRQDNTDVSNDTQVQAQDNEGRDETENAPEKKDEKPAEAEISKDDQQQEAAAAYAYVAQPGDTYSQMARKALQTYGINNDVELSNAQIIYAETMLTQEAGSPELNEGQKVTIDESKVKSWAEKAGDLSDAKEKAWAAYAVGVDFNTDNVGESR